MENSKSRLLYLSKKETVKDGFSISDVAELEEHQAFDFLTNPTAPMLHNTIVAVQKKYKPPEENHKDFGKTTTQLLYTFHSPIIATIPFRVFAYDQYAKLKQGVENQFPNVYSTEESLCVLNMEIEDVGASITYVGTAAFSNYGVGQMIFSYPLRSIHYCGQFAFNQRSGNGLMITTMQSTGDASLHARHIYRGEFNGDTPNGFGEEAVYPFLNNDYYYKVVSSEIGPNTLLDFAADYNLSEVEKFAVEPSWKYLLELVCKKTNQTLNPTARYHGDIVDGIWSGAGIYTNFTSHFTWDGGMDKNRPNGVGIYSVHYGSWDEVDSSVSKGNCVDGQFDGPVICAIRNSLYHGLYQKGKRHGFGEERFPGGETLCISYVGGRKNGFGVLYFPSEDKVMGHWDGRNMVGKAIFHDNKEGGNYVIDFGPTSMAAKLSEQIMEDKIKNHCVPVPEEAPSAFRSQFEAIKLRVICYKKIDEELPERHFPELNGVLYSRDNGFEIFEEVIYLRPWQNTMDIILFCRRALESSEVLIASSDSTLSTSSICREFCRNRCLTRVLPRHVSIKEAGLKNEHVLFAVAGDSREKRIGEAGYQSLLPKYISLSEHCVGIQFQGLRDYPKYRPFEEPGKRVDEVDLVQNVEKLYELVVEKHKNKGSLLFGVDGDVVASLNEQEQLFFKLLTEKAKGKMRKKKKRSQKKRKKRKARRGRAIVCIQSVWRGYMVRKRVKCIIKIQAVLRGHLIRKRIKGKREQKRKFQEFMQKASRIFEARGDHAKFVRLQGMSNRKTTKKELLNFFRGYDSLLLAYSRDVIQFVSPNDYLTAKYVANYRKKELRQGQKKQLSPIVKEKHVSAPFQKKGRRISPRKSLDVHLFEQINRNKKVFVERKTPKGQQATTRKFKTKTTKEGNVKKQSKKKSGMVNGPTRRRKKKKENNVTERGYIYSENVIVQHTSSTYTAHHISPKYMNALPEIDVTNKSYFVHDVHKAMNGLKVHPTIEEVHHFLLTLLQKGEREMVFILGNKGLKKWFVYMANEVALAKWIEPFTELGFTLRAKTVKRERVHVDGVLFIYFEEIKKK
ncbi:MAG: hypothetical protein CMH46_00085 [Muricauda sp.]|nr:IQ calmodulin-binding motif-containing protein [Allomuricauda sp.]MAU13920.1 hypothetical protein [Allomuricauda sp.]